MNNETYTFIQTQKERNSMRHGAFARKDGSKSKRCSLPSDNLSPAQKRKLNGPIESINLNQTMTFIELKGVSPSLQSAYLHHLVDDLGARRMDLEEMLGVSTPTLSRLFRAMPDPPTFKKRGKGSRQADPRWVEFIGAQVSDPAPETQGEDIPPEVIVEAPTPDPTPEPEKVDPNPPTPIHLLAGSFTVRGKLVDLLGAMAVYLTDPDSDYTFTLSFTA